MILCFADNSIAKNNQVVSETINANSTEKTIIPDKTLLTIEEIAVHNSSADCWIIINNGIYNVTSYLNIHPGEAKTILPYCGGEASNAFATRDEGRPHSPEATQLLDSYFVGVIS